MPAPFFRTMRSLEAETKHRSAASFFVAITLLTAWTAWLALARVSLYEVGTVRLEVDRAAHGVEAVVAGRVVEQHLALDLEVHKGDVLVLLDSSAEELKLSEAKARWAGIEAKLKTLVEQKQSAERLSAARHDVHSAKIGEARAHTKEATTGASFADEEAVRGAKLHAEGVLSAADLAKLEADAKARKAAVDARRTAASREAAELQVNDTEFALDLARLAERTAELTMQRDEEAAIIKTLEYSIEQHRIRSPIDGKLGQMAVVLPGTILERGTRVASIVPTGNLRAIAQLTPHNALGRVRPGHSARLRIDGFPWAEYGTVPARVRHVATEVHDEQVRVELEVLPAPGSAIPIQHGLPGSVEIEIERISPLSLVLRSVGRYLRPEGGSF